MVQAEEKVVEFVKGKKDHQKYEISSCSPSGEGWNVKGSCSTSKTGSFYSENFEVILDKEGNVTSYNFTPGGSFVIG